MTDRQIGLPLVVKQFMRAHDKLVEEWRDTGLRFTLDGRLVGDIAEALAGQAFGLHFPTKRTPGVDLFTVDRRSVQVKASGIGKGPAFTPGEGTAHYLIFMLIDFRKLTASIVYNGPEQPVRNELPAGFQGTKRVKLDTVRVLDASQTDRLKRI